MNVVAIVALVLVGLMLAMQVAIRLKVRALRGKPLPELSGAWSQRLGGGAQRLLYFFSPGCVACKTLTPRFEALQRKKPNAVFVVNVADDLPLARALNVMATPSIVEIASLSGEGKGEITEGDREALRARHATIVDGNPQRVSMPSRDGMWPAEPSSSPHDGGRPSPGGRRRPGVHGRTPVPPVEEIHTAAAARL